MTFEEKLFDQWARPPKQCVSCQDQQHNLCLATGAANEILGPLGYGVKCKCYDASPNFHKALSGVKE